MEISKELTLGQRLRQRRVSKQWSQERLAEALETSAMTVRRWEHDVTVPQMRFRPLLCELFSCSHDELFAMLDPVSAMESAHATVWTVPFLRNPYFTGRTLLLNQLSDRLAIGQQIDATRIVALTGQGGIGKTQIAVEYAYRHLRDYRAVLWLSAESPETLAASFSQVAGALGIPEPQEANQQSFVAGVRRWLTSNRKWLLIIDNVEDPTVIADFLPPTRHGAILLTTRQQALGGLTLGLDVPPLTQEESVTLVRRRGRLLPSSEASEAPSAEAAARTLVALLDGLPLALDQAGAYIEETGCGIAWYLDRFTRSGSSLLTRRGANAGSHPQSVVTTILLAVEQVRDIHPAATQLLWFCSFLHAEAIPEELLAAGATPLETTSLGLPSDPVQLDHAVAALRRFSLVARSAETRTVSVHRLTQQVLRQQLDAAAVRAWSTRVICAVNSVFPQVTFAQWRKCARYLPHALACVPLIEQTPPAFADATALLNKTGNYLLQRGRYRDAEPVLTLALDRAEAAAGPDEASLLPILVQLGVLRKREGRYDFAAASLQRAHTISERCFGPDHLDTARTIGELADLFRLQGNLVEAARFGQRALALVQERCGPEHPETAEALASLASCWREEGKFAEAEELFVRALAILNQHLDRHHPQTANFLNEYALCALQQGKVEQAAALLRRVVTLCARFLGAKHPETAHALNALGMVYRRQGNLSEALTAHERARTIRARQIGVQSLDVAESLHNLATVHEDLGHIDKARRLYEQALAIDERHLGPDHPMLGFPLNRLALLSSAAEEYAQAEAAGARALALRRQQLGPTHPLTATSLVTLATIYRAQGKDAQAHRLFQRALRIRTRCLGPENPATLQARRRIGSSDSDAGKDSG
jgi:tetratricopeptide (TPR) repeat protein/transcriptional regulator with XRE-family HTH domain